MPNFTYTRDIPAGNLTPAQNRPNMEINTNSSDSIWDVDHYGFNDNNGGTHQKITFPLNISDPGAGPFTPLIFTKNDAFTIPQLFYYTGTSAQSSTQYVAAASGSVLLLGGIIIKWGTGTANNTAPVNNFTPPFPHTCFAVTANQFAQTGTPSAVSVSNFNVSSFRAGSPGPLNIVWIAIGN